MLATDKPTLNAGLSWRQPAVFIASTAACTVLAIWAVISAPVGVMGVSGLYLAAAVYVPLALWFGIWGCLAGYLSCLFVGFYLGIPLPYLAVWSLADFFEGFVPMVIYRSLKVKPAIQLKRPLVTGGLSAVLVADVVLSAFALVSNMTELFIVTFVIGIAGLVAQAAAEDYKTWITWLVVGVVVASFVSGIFGVGAMAAFSQIPMEIFGSVFFGWVFGDILVLSTVGTVLAIVLTPYIVKSRVHVRRYFS